MIEKLGITEIPWIVHEFKYRGHNKVHTHEIHYGKDGECVAEYVAKKADADLISTAPEMLEALIDMCTDAEMLDQGSRFSGVEAIEKATGLTWDEVKEKSDE